MKAKSSSSSSSSSSFSSVDTTDVEKNHPHLSASYIRSLVKQLTSSATTKQDPSEENGFLSPRQKDPTRIISSTNSDEQPENPPPPPQKRRPRRRRTQTTKPYQERMLNMAEARREIVTALKLHRKAREIQPARPEFHPPGRPEAGSYSSYSWPVSYAGLALPGRALGLNLNLQDFDKTAVFQYSATNPPSTHESPSTFASAAAAEVVGFVPPALDFVESPFDEVMEFPGWMSAEESVNADFLPDAYFQDRALPCMKIEEIGGIDDGDWLA